jgi:4-hydroxy-3-polyprenylbenzoate decarboxylase
LSYKSLSHFIHVLEQAGELIRIREFVSPRLEITEIADRMVKNGGKAMLFENNGTSFPLLINAFASDRRICMALGVDDLDEVGREIFRIFKEFLGPKDSFLDKLRVLPTLQELSSWMPKVVSGKGACQEVLMSRPDLSLLPVLTCWPADGGPFITLPGVHTKDPLTGIRNLGMYRMQVFGNNLTGMHWHLHKGAATHYHQYKALGKRMPVSVTLGGDPAYTYAATAPLPENIDEYLLAGFLRKKKVELVKCLTNELEVPADVDFVIEGYIDPREELIQEGPFGDHTGFYSLADFFPRFHVACITHRRNAVYPTTIVGIPPQEDGWIGKATEKIFLAPMKLSVVPELADMHMPLEGVFHNIVLSKIKIHYPGQAIKVMNALWGAGQMMFNKILVVTDGNTPLTDYISLLRFISEQVDPLNDIHFIKGPVDILDHSSTQFAFGSKMGIDATGKPAIPRDRLFLSGPPRVDIDQILERFPEIIAINSGLLSQGISALILFIQKERKQHIRELSQEIMENSWIEKVKFIVFMDALACHASYSSVVWMAANNLDPMRDCFHVTGEQGESFPTLFLDGTRKTKEMDGFSRDWPNVIVMEDAMIALVDRKWDSYGIGPLLSSPSLIYKSLTTNDGAVNL